MKVILAIAALFFIGLGAFYTVGSKVPKESIPPTVQKEVNYQATFAIFTNGTLREFTDSKYHNRSVDVFIASENPSIVNVKKKGVAWDDFFKTLPSPMKLSKDCLTTGAGQRFCSDKDKSLKFFLNGQRDDNLLSKEIIHKDQALLTYGNETDKQIEDQMSKIPKLD